MAKPDRHLKKRGEMWTYQRAVPKVLHDADKRAPVVQIALQTRDKMEARSLRDSYEHADNRLWAALKAGLNAKDAREQHEADIELVRAMNMEPRPGASFKTANPDDMREAGARIIQIAKTVSKKPLWELSEQEIDNLVKSPGFDVMVPAALGLNKRPKTLLSDALELYLNELSHNERLGKNEEQSRIFNNVRRQGVNNFMKVVSDRPVMEITRTEAIDFLAYLRKRHLSGDLSANAANKQLAALSVVIAAYAEHIGELDHRNPFERLKRFKASKTTRQSYKPKWVKQKFLQGYGLAAMNAEARHILLMVVATGMRPIEITELAPHQIVLDAKIPFIEIRSIDDGPYKHQLKTKSSERMMPLLGLSLAVMEQHSQGFERYRGKSNSATTTINKYLSENGLQQDGCTLYGLRHMLENRLRDKGIGDDLRRGLFGHKVPHRPEYGDQYSLKQKRKALRKIELPFDPAII
jgi:integrase